MISFLKGTFIDWDGEAGSVDVGGVGYEVHLAQNSGVISELGQLVELWIHTHVREDQITLFGFADKSEKKMFLSLLKVNGIGPKLALKVISGSNLASLVSMIEQNDVAGLSKIPKVGKKTAEQIVITLKGKLEGVTDHEIARFSAPSSAKNQIKFALINLGFKQNDVEKAIVDYPDDIDLQEGIRRGLSELSQL